MKILQGVKEIKDSNTRPSIVTLTLNRYGWVMDSAHRLTEAKFHQSLMKIFPGVKEIWSGHTFKSGREIKDSNSWPSIVTLTLSLHGLLVDSAYSLNKANTWPKLNENPYRGKGNME